MRPQTTVKVLEWTLLAVLVAQHLLAYRVLKGFDDQMGLWSLHVFGYYDFLFPLQDGLLFAQVALLIMWMHLGPGPWFVRWPLIGSLAWALSTVARDEYFVAGVYSANNRATQLLVCQMALVVLWMLVIQLCGFRLRKVDQIGPPTRLWQFSLRNLLVTVLLTGVAVRVGHLAYQHVLQQPRLSEWLAIGSVALPLALTPLLGLWGTLRPGMWWLRLLFFAVIAPTLGLAGPYYCGHLTEWPGFVVWTGVEGFVVAATLLVIRGCGYRLVRQACLSETSAVNEASFSAAGG